MNYRFWVLILIPALSLIGCSSTPKELRAPCTHFGLFCRQIPINCD